MEGKLGEVGRLEKLKSMLDLESSDSGDVKNGFTHLDWT